MTWTPVSEGLPDDDELVLVTYKMGVLMSVRLGTYDGGWWVNGARLRDQVTAWQPLPEPYREGEK